MWASVKVFDKMLVMASLHVCVVSRAVSAASSAESLMRFALCNSNRYATPPSQDIHYYVYFSNWMEVVRDSKEGAAIPVAVSPITEAVYKLL